MSFREWGMSAWVRLVIWRRARLVGTDAFGNRYFRDGRNPRAGRTERRWVLYNGESEASRVPPEWHGWLHYQTDLPPTERAGQRPAWIKPHVPNLTGTLAAWRPPGSMLKGGKRPAATGDYEPWTPGS